MHRDCVYRHRCPLNSAAQETLLCLAAGAALAKEIFFSLKEEGLCKEGYFVFITEDHNLVIRVL
jgi:hypothetical protein